MEKYLLRGFVTPEDMTGTDSQRIQAAIDLAGKLDINKVILEGSYVCQEPVILPAGIHLQLNGRLQIPALRTRRPENYSFTQRYLYIDGTGRLDGDIELFNCEHVTVNNLTMFGHIRLEYCRQVRMERVTIPEGGIVLGRGCSVFSMQDMFIHGEETALRLDGNVGTGIVPGIDPTIANVAVYRCGLLTQAPAVVLQASASVGLLNIQVEWITAEHVGVQVGTAGEALPQGSYQNITLERIVSQTPVVNHAKILHFLQAHNGDDRHGNC